MVAFTIIDEHYDSVKFTIVQLVFNLADNSQCCYVCVCNSELASLGVDYPVKSYGD